jgi:hypothetical protein
VRTRARPAESAEVGQKTPRKRRSKAPHKTGSQEVRPAWTPNPNGKAPDFEPGNVVSLKHGAYSPRVIAERAEAVRPRLFEVCPWLDELQDVIAVDRFLRAEARALILHDYAMRMSPDQTAVKVWEQATAADNLAAKLGATLGLDPMSRARLQQTVASTELTLADLVRQGEAAMAERGDPVLDVDGEEAVGE